MLYLRFKAEERLEESDSLFLSEAGTRRSFFVVSAVSAMLQLGGFRPLTVSGNK